MSHPSDPGLPRPFVNIPPKPVLSAVFKDHVASLEHAHFDTHIVKIDGPAASAWSSTDVIASTPIPVGAAMHQSTPNARVEGGTLVSRGWLEGR